MPPNIHNQPIQRVTEQALIGRPVFSFNEANMRIDNLIQQGARNGTPKDTVLDQVMAFLKQYPQALAGLKVDGSRADVMNKVVGPRYDAAAKTFGKDPASDPGVMKKDKEKLKNGEIVYKPIEGELFVDGASPNDINQGTLGDCYFLAAIGSVADSNPKFIEESIKANDDGTFTVRFFDDQGKPVHVTVDRDIPQTKSGTPIYGSGTNKKEIWVPIMEKAYAKWKNGYQKVNGGYPDKALRELTGSKSKKIGHGTSSDKLFSEIEKALQEGRPVTASTSGNKKKLKDMGIVSRHAYSVVDVKVEDGKKYVVLRNPWGHTEWSGQGADKKSDGTFKIPIDDYKKYFANTAISTASPIVALPAIEKNLKWLAA